VLVEEIQVVSTHLQASERLIECFVPSDGATLNMYILKRFEDKKSLFTLHVCHRGPRRRGVLFFIKAHLEVFLRACQLAWRSAERVFVWKRGQELRKVRGRGVSKLTKSRRSLCDGNTSVSPTSMYEFRTTCS
jgi:hypothetical protein